MSKQKIIRTEHVNKHIFKYVFEDLSYFTFNFVNFERRYYNENGQPHREDGPAVVWADGTKSWYKNDQRHREDGPAVVHANGDKVWYKNGQLHREDGPAVVFADGTKWWYLDNKEYSEQEWKAELKRRSKK